MSRRDWQRDSAVSATARNLHQNRTGLRGRWFSRGNASVGGVAVSPWGLPGAVRADRIWMSDFQPRGMLPVSQTCQRFGTTLSLAQDCLQGPVSEHRLHRRHVRCHCAICTGRLHDRNQHRRGCQLRRCASGREKRYLVDPYRAGSKVSWCVSQLRPESALPALIL